MRLDTEPEDEAFRLSARGWLAANRPDRRAPPDGPDHRAFATAWLQRCHQAGWSGVAWPETCGGQGLPPNAS